MIRLIHFEMYVRTVLPLLLLPYNYAVIVERSLGFCLARAKRELLMMAIFGEFAFEVSRLIRFAVHTKMYGDESR